MVTIALAAHIILGQLSGQALLDDLSRRAVQYFWEQSSPTSGLTRDRAPIKKGDKENNATIASIAATGYALSAYAIGTERGWLDREKALERARRTVRTVLTKLEGTHGWYYHFVDWNTGKREWNCEVSSIDSGLLFAGMWQAERGLRDPELSGLVKEVFGRIDWKWMLTDGGAVPDSLTFCHGWKPEDKFLKARWAGFCELMFLYVLGYALFPDMPSASWGAWNRPEVEYESLHLLGGGPLFMHQMSQGFFDFKDYRDNLGYDYWVEGRNATLANRLYCIKNPERFDGYGPDIWGLSACDVPDGYNAQGAPGWISDNGTLAPAAAVASVIYTKDLSVRAAEAFVRKYPESYGTYGFTTGLNPTKKWQSPDTIGIDIGQLMLNIENARDGLPNRWMMEDIRVRIAYQKIGLRKTNEGKSESRPLKKLLNQHFGCL